MSGTDRPRLGVGMVGYAFMGAAHSLAWRTAPRFFDLPRAAGKHVLCEKPLANTLAEAERMAEAARAAEARGQVVMVGFTYRRVLAVQLARQLVEEGRIGRVRHVRAQYLQDWIADPEVPLSWRLDREKAGSGALGDIGAHVVDLAQFVTGE